MCPTPRLCPPGSEELQLLLSQVPKLCAVSCELCSVQVKGVLTCYRECCGLFQPRGQMGKEVKYPYCCSVKRICKALLTWVQEDLDNLVPLFIV